jgi:hypothetical protein
MLDKRNDRLPVGENINRNAQFFTIEEISTLRNAKTEREKDAVFWFFEHFIDCVAGRKVFGKFKYLQTISTGQGSFSESSLTVSDEALGLLLFENYYQKWMTQHKHNREHSGSGNQEKMDRIHGKYTPKKMGQTEFGGWNVAGVKQFNRYCAMVSADRKSTNAVRAEAQLLQHLQQTVHGAKVMKQFQKKERNEQSCNTHIVLRHK